MSNPPVGTHSETAALYAVMENRPADLNRVLGDMLDNELNDFWLLVATLANAVKSEQNTRILGQLRAEERGV